MDIQAFRKKYPQFVDEIKYPDEYLQNLWEFAECLISFVCKCGEKVRELLVAHLASLDPNKNGEGGNGSSGVIASASIDKISVSFAQNPTSSEYLWWLNKTYYGQLLAMILKGCSVGGDYIGGSRERAGFRKIGGGFVC